MKSCTYGHSYQSLNTIKQAFCFQWHWGKHSQSCSEMKSCVWLKFKVLKRCWNSKAAFSLQVFINVVEVKLHSVSIVNTFLIKFAKYFIWFVMCWWKRALCWSPGVCWRGKIKWRKRRLRRCEGLSRFQCSASVPRATREAVWGPTYLTAQRMSCIFYAHTLNHTLKHLTPEAFLFVTRHTFLSPSLQILVCWQPAGFLSCRAEEWRA